MIKEVDEDDDGAICFREFLLIFRKAAAGELDLESGLGKLATLTEVDVDTELTRRRKTNWGFQRRSGIWLDRI